MQPTYSPSHSKLILKTTTPYDTTIMRNDFEAKSLESQLEDKPNLPKHY